jgi:Domain of unknown function (DUF4401)
MKNTAMTVGELLEHPEVSPWLRPGDAENMASALSTSSQRSKEPIYIRILSGIGAWFASMFIIGFLGMADIIDGEVSLVLCGVVFLAVAVALAKFCTSTFPSQLALALVLAGNGMLVAGLTKVADSSSYQDPTFLAVLVSHGVVCTTLYMLFPSTVYRFFASLVLGLIATLWVTFELKTFETLHLLIAVEMLLFGVLLLHTRRTSFVRPLLRASAVMLPSTILFMHLTQGMILDWHIWKTGSSNQMLPTTALLAMGMVYLLFRLSGSSQPYRQPWFIAAVVATLLLGLFTSPGILVALGLLIAGYAFGDRALTTLAYLFLPCFLVVFYYAMNISLAHKSWMVAGSGLILLAVRWFLQQRAPKEVAS